MGLPFSPASESAPRPIKPRRGFIPWPAALQHAKNACDFNEISAGTENSAIVRPEILAALPSQVAERMKILAFYCAEYSGVQMFADQWGNRHDRRRRWRNNLPAQSEVHGEELKSYFKSNKLGANNIQKVVAAARIAERGIRSAEAALEESTALQSILPHINAIMDMCGGTGEFQGPNKRLSSDQKKRMLSVATDDTGNENFATRYLRMGMSEKQAVVGYLLNEVDSILETLTLPVEKA